MNSYRVQTKLPENGEVHGGSQDSGGTNACFLLCFEFICGENKN